MSWRAVWKEDNKNDDIIPINVTGILEPQVPTEPQMQSKLLLFSCHRPRWSQRFWRRECSGPSSDCKSEENPRQEGWPREGTREEEGEEERWSQPGGWAWHDTTRSSIEPTRSKNFHECSGSSLVGAWEHGWREEGEVRLRSLSCHLKSHDLIPSGLENVSWQAIPWIPWGRPQRWFRDVDAIPAEGGPKGDRQGDLGGDSWLRYSQISGASREQILGTPLVDPETGKGYSGTLWTSVEEMFDQQHGQGGVHNGFCCWRVQFGKSPTHCPDQLEAWVCKMPQHLPQSPLSHLWLRQPQIDCHLWTYPWWFSTQVRSQSQLLQPYTTMERWDEEVPRNAGREATRLSFWLWNPHADGLQVVSHWRSHHVRRLDLQSGIDRCLWHASRPVRLVQQGLRDQQEEVSRVHQEQHFQRDDGRKQADEDRASRNWKIHGSQGQDWEWPDHGNRKARRVGGAGLSGDEGRCLRQGISTCKDHDTEPHRSATIAEESGRTRAKAKEKGREKAKELATLNLKTWSTPRSPSFLTSIVPIPFAVPASLMGTFSAPCATGKLVRPPMHVWQQK